MAKASTRRVSPRTPSKKAVKVATIAKAAKPTAKPTKSKAASAKDTKFKNRLSQAVLEDRAAKASVHWEQCFKDLEAFKEDNGHCLVPKMFSENQTLAYWVQRNRKHYNLFQSGQKSLLTAERIERLEDMDFLFRARGADVQAEIEKKKKREKGVEKWNKHFGEMCEYKNVHSNCLVPKLFKENRALASWVYNQRFQFKKKGEGDDVPLNDERIEKLNAIGFCWKAKSNDEWRESDRDRRREKSQDGWDDKYAKLVTFQKRKGHTLVPKTYKKDQPLSSWVFRQRRQYGFRQLGEPNSLSEDRLKKLKALKFVFRVRPERTLSPPRKSSSRQTRGNADIIAVDGSKDDEDEAADVEAEAELKETAVFNDTTSEMTYAVARVTTERLSTRRSSSRKSASAKNDGPSAMDENEDDRKMPAKDSREKQKKLPAKNQEPAAVADESLPVKGSRNQTKRASDKGDSKLPAESSREEKETAQPADEGEVPAKRSRRSKEKAQPANDDDNKVPAKKSRKSQEIAKPVGKDDSKVPAKKSSRNQARKAKNDALLVDKDDTKLPAKRSSKKEKKKPERKPTGKRTLVATQNDVESGGDKDSDKLKNAKNGMKEPNAKMDEDAIESDSDDLAIVEEDGKKKMFISSESEADSESSDDCSSSSDNESDSSEDELPTEKYASDAYEKSDDDMPSSVERKSDKKGHMSKKTKSAPKRTLKNKSKKNSPQRM